MDSTPRSNARWIVAALLVALVALALWIAFSNDVPSGAYQP